MLGAALGCFLDGFAQAESGTDVLARASRNVLGAGLEAGTEHRPTTGAGTDGRFSGKKGQVCHEVSYFLRLMTARSPALRANRLFSLALRRARLAVEQVHIFD